MPENGQERSEQPTSRRREEARRDGSFAGSRELSSFLVILGGVLVLYFSGVWITSGLAEVMGEFLRVGRHELTVEGLIRLFKGLSIRFVVLIAPAMLIPLFGAASYLIQNGLMLTTKPLEPDLGRISPLKGMKRLLSLSSVAELVKSLMKVAVIGFVVYLSVSREFAVMPALMKLDAAGSFFYIAKVSFRIMTKTAWVLAVIAILDYAYQRWQFEKGLRMTREEVREEMRELEGDPMVKARIRSMQKDLARKRMMQEVPKADVVVTNPTHLAVALRYDRSKMKAPRVVAKGAALVAERIKEIAREHHVPVIENKPLAQSLYKGVEVGGEIPASLFRAVAEILAYVYRLRTRVRQ